MRKSDPPEQRQGGKTHSAAQPPLAATLSPHWAFVVQFREGTALTATAMQGRVEHIVSGRQAHFYSLEELRVAMEQMLTEIRDKPP
jgi:hypothetical protein